MSKKICIFIDGENFRHSLAKLFQEQFKSIDYLPHSNWAALFDFFTSRVSVESEKERLRTYWYVVESLVFRPYKLPDAIKETNELKDLLCKNRGLRQILNKIKDKKQLISEMKKIAHTLDQRKKSIRPRFEGWKNIENNISFHHPRVEFRKSGTLTYNLLTKQFSNEKTVDVKLATDLLRLSDIYDVAVIVSGDQDYVPAVEAIKMRGKTVINVVFRSKAGKLLPGGAWRLNQHTDDRIEVTHDEIKSYFTFQGRLFSNKTGGK